MTQGELEKLAIPLQKKMSDLEQRVMTDIVRRIKINGFSTASADWQISRLQQLGESEESIRKWIQEALAATDEELERIFSDEVYQEYYGHSRVYKHSGVEQIPLEENEELQQLITAVKRQTSETFQNMTGSTGFAIRNPATGQITYSPLLEYYQNTLDAAMLDIKSGAFDYRTVLNRTITQMTNSGLRWVDYDSGWHNRVDVAARRAVLTGIQQVQGKINEQVAHDLGTDSYEVTYHVGARPSHQAWQGRVWTMQQLIDVCGLGTVTGLKGANCYHDYNAFIPGVSVRTYTDAQLDEMMAEENTPKTYNGREYTTYEALQQQRKMETSMRATRQQIKLLEEGGADEQDIILKRARYQGQMQTYKDFSQKMKLPEQTDRVYQDGLKGRFMPTQAEKKKMEKPVAKAPDSDIIKVGDTVIHKGVGAKTKNYDIRDPETNELFHFAEGTRIQDSEVFAGKGAKKPLKSEVAQGLAEQIGGSPSKWQHCKGHGIIDYYGEERPAEVHWFQEETVGKHKFKIKRWEDEG